MVHVTDPIVLPDRFARAEDAWSTARAVVGGLAADDTEPGFRCGLEFDTVAAEARYFAGHGIDIDAVEHGVVLQPGQVLIFDNLHYAHGRIGVRATGELHQRCLGFAGLPVAAQDEVLMSTLSCLTGQAGIA